jgi:hypothetical protein
MERAFALVDRRCLSICASVPVKLHRATCDFCTSKAAATEHATAATDRATCDYCTSKAAQSHLRSTNKKKIGASQVALMLY